MAKLIDVAREASVSIGAASSVLGGRSSTIGTSPATRQRILDAARRLGYTPSPAAISLSTGRTHTIGLMIHDVLTYLSHPSGARTIADMCNGAAEMGYRILLMMADPDNTLDARLMDGCIILGWTDEAETKLIQKLARQIPVINHSGPPIAGTIAVTVQNRPEERIRIAADYLYGLGHRRLAIVDTAPRKSKTRDIFRKIAAERGIEVDITAFSDSWRTRAYPTVHEVAKLSPMPTAIFAFDDDYARALIARLAHEGWRVPADISIFSSSTHRDGFQITPALTGVDCHQDQQTTQIITAFITALRDKQPLKEIKLDFTPVELIERESCLPLRPGG